MQLGREQVCFHQVQMTLVIVPLIVSPKRPDVTGASEPQYLSGIVAIAGALTLAYVTLDDLASALAEKEIVLAYLPSSEGAVRSWSGPLNQILLWLWMKSGWI